MRDILHEVVDRMETPTADLRAEAASVEATEAAHAAYLQDWPCLQTIEQAEPPCVLPEPRELTVAAWNLERCKRVEESADLIRRSGADLVLATEMDHGMARSGQRHTTRDLAGELGFGYVFGTEFVELGTGDPYEASLFSGVPNDHGLHGNAILSRYPLRHPKVIPLDDRGLWFTASPKEDGQRRVGGRMAITAELDTAFGPVEVVAVHFESEGNGAGRLAQAETLLSGLGPAHSGAPTVIGGDLNTADLAGRSAWECLTRPDTFEPCFGAFSNSGFTWKTSNDGHPTTRAAPGRPVRYPLKRLDWLFTRNVSGVDAMTVPAISRSGDYLSDHELITARIAS